MKKLPTPSTIDFSASLDLQLSTFSFAPKHEAGSFPQLHRISSGQAGHQGVASTPALYILGPFLACAIFCLAIF